MRLEFNKKGPLNKELRHILNVDEITDGLKNPPEKIIIEKNLNALQINKTGNQNLNSSDINDLSPLQLGNAKFGWLDKLKLGLLIILIIVYIGFLIKSLIYEIKRIRDVQHMINRMRPIIAALYKMDANVAREVQRAVNSYSTYNLPLPEEDYTHF
ncbi:unnamed protein product [Pieris macdunnoughi]|uniref:Uncharacterized protein n=1 Tax=Pieris macdunnoughi TaxID=345717 RepID=A0A821Y5U6_9NEOP|nr:unnamed protein product [Pieris macdunnoughi]